MEAQPWERKMPSLVRDGGLALREMKA